MLVSDRMQPGHVSLPNGTGLVTLTYLSILGGNTRLPRRREAPFLRTPKGTHQRSAQAFTRMLFLSTIDTCQNRAPGLPLLILCGWLGTSASSRRSGYPGPPA